MRFSILFKKKKKKKKRIYVSSNYIAFAHRQRSDSHFIPIGIPQVLPHLFFGLRKIKNHAVPFISVGMGFWILFILRFAYVNAILLFLFLNRMDGVTLALGVAYKA